MNLSFCMYLIKIKGSLLFECVLNSFSCNNYFGDQKLLNIVNFVLMHTLQHLKGYMLVLSKYIIHIKCFSYYFFLGGEIVLYFVQVAALGPLWGYFMAKITLFFLSRVFNDALIEITITLASTYMTYYIGQFDLPFRESKIMDTIQYAVLTRLY